ncbi:unnamed protein product [Blepharisma stoltei]|uniref:Mei2-like C-terminal RNA recognition motif domain-containing protein n=1 Tax=Blepharisma stoltei TaxID=1481888 RepID=A0AAU9JY98_9CILI|nr:unnamed protein product [Blepharisma stoltei]
MSSYLGKQPKRKRLKVFESLTDAHDEPVAVTRMLEVSNVPCISTLLAHSRTFGEIQLFDSSRAACGIFRIAYYDIRDAEKAKNELESSYDISYASPGSDSKFSDYIIVPQANFIYHAYLRYGEIMSTEVIGAYIIVRYFDVRASKRTYSEPYEFEEDQFFENEFHDTPLLSSQLDLSISSESTSPSPYFFFGSESSSRESPYDDRKKPRKKPLDEEEKMFFIIRLETLLSGEETRTTVMIKNIPNKYTQQMLLDSIDKHFSKTYDFFYLPIDFKNKCNVGYAFINFLEPVTIVKFYEEYNGKRWERFNSEKICALAYARIQGRQGLIQHFQCSSVMNQDDTKVKPLILQINPQF